MGVPPGAELACDEGWGFEAFGRLSDGVFADGVFAEEVESAGRNPLVSELISETGFSELHPIGATIAVTQAVPIAKPIAD